MMMMMMTMMMMMMSLRLDANANAQSCTSTLFSALWRFSAGEGGTTTTSSVFPHVRVVEKNDIVVGLCTVERDAHGVVDADVIKCGWMWEREEKREERFFL